MRKLPFAACFILLSAFCYSQDSTKLIHQYISGVTAKATSLNQQLNKKSEDALRSLERIEAKMKRKLARIDSAKAKQLFPGLQKNIESKAGPYIPSLDSMSTALAFLGDNAALARVKELQAQFGKADRIKKLLEDRRKYLKDELAKLGFAKELKKLNKQVYYYSAQVNEYKSLLKDKRKRERKALELLSQNKQFKEFMRKNSQLASLFRLPGNNDLSTPANLAGLQTRAQVNNLIQQQIGAGGRQQLTQNVQAAQSQLQQLKNKIISKGGGSSDDIMPEGFRPNSQKTKKFWDRLEYGTNLQTVRGTGLLPVTSDLGLSLGYRLKKEVIIGFGASYKLGWGKNIRNINITHQGMGVRSFLDIKIPSPKGGAGGGLWISGGYEMNYRPALNNVMFSSPAGRGQEAVAWQQSGLIGLSKVVSVRSKFFKKTKLQLLWDFLSYEQVPVTQPIVFRVGYNLK